MHELLLFGQLPAARHDRILNVLTGTSGMQPQRILQRHLIFKPTRAVVQPTIVRGGAVKPDAQNLKSKGTKAAVPGADLYHVKLVMDVGEDLGEHGGSWRLRFEDVPEPGKRSALLRMVEESSLTEGDALSYIEGLGYEIVADYVTEGHRFIQGDIVLYLHRIVCLKDIPATESFKSPLPPMGAAFEPLDPTNGYLLQAFVRLSDGANPVIVNMGLEALDGFRARMKGVIDMKTPERLALDTRVK